MLIDLVDSVLAAINTAKVDLSFWTMEELTEFVRHFNYVAEDLEEYLVQKIEETENQKRSDDMFDFDDEVSGGKAGTKPFDCASFACPFFGPQLSAYLMSQF